MDGLLVDVQLSAATASLVSCVLSAAIATGCGLPATTMIVNIDTGTVSHSR
jgi:hypothetical protein